MRQKSGVVAKLFAFFSSDWFSNFWFRVWLAIRLLRVEKSLLSPMGWVSLVGLSLGVACLVVSMAVVSGFESTLRRHIIDVTGHLQIIQLAQSDLSWEEFFEKTKKIVPRLQSAMPFVRLEALAANSGKLSGIYLQGLGPQCCVLQLEQKVLQGNLDFLKETRVPETASPRAKPEKQKSSRREQTSGQTSEKAIEGQVGIGKVLAAELNLQVGDVFKILIPLNSETNTNQFRRKMIGVKVAAILDFGKFEFNQRTVLTGLSQLQGWAEIGQKILGLLVRDEDAAAALVDSRILGYSLGSKYRVWDWREVNATLFQAVETEKPVLFLVIGLIVLAAAFNVSTSLNVHVAQKTPQLATLKAIGLSRKGMQVVFLLQGFVMAILGCLFGLILGILFCGSFQFLETHFGLIPGDVYKIDRIGIDLRWSDFFAIVSCTLAVCLLAVWSAAQKGSRIEAVEGLRYE